MQPELSFALLSYRSPELLKLSLDALKKSLAESKRSYEILVVDSATEENTELLLREEFPEIQFIPHTKNVGFRALVNTALSLVKGKTIFLMNADVLFTRGVIEKATKYLEQHPEIGLIGPKQLHFDGSLQQTCFHFYQPQTILYRRTWLKHLSFAKKHLAWFTMEDFDRKYPREVDWIMGSVLITRREHVEKVGFMDDRFFMYMEDVDWCRRFWEAGLKVVYYPEITVYHYLGKGSARGGLIRSLLFNRLTWYHIVSGVKYFMKYFGKPTPHLE